MFSPRNSVNYECLEVGRNIARKMMEDSSFQDYFDLAQKVVITAPKSGAVKDDEKNNDHIGRIIGEGFEEILNSKNIGYSYLSPYDILDLGEPLPGRMSRIEPEEKIQEKYANWKPIRSPEDGTEHLLSRRRIQPLINADVVFFVDDTLLRHSTFLRLAMIIRNFNESCPIIACVNHVVTGSTPTPSDVYQLLVRYCD